MVSYATLHTMYVHRENKMIEKELVSEIPKVMCPENTSLFTPILILVLGDSLGHP